MTVLQQFAVISGTNQYVRRAAEPPAAATSESRIRTLVRVRTCVWEPGEYVDENTWRQIVLHAVRRLHAVFEKKEKNLLHLKDPNAEMAG